MNIDIDQLVNKASELIGYKPLRELIATPHNLAIKMMDSVAGLAILIAVCYLLRNNRVFRVYLVVWICFFGLPMLGINLHKMVLKSLKTDKATVEVIQLKKEKEGGKEKTKQNL